MEEEKLEFQRQKEEEHRRHEFELKRRQKQFDDDLRREEAEHRQRLEDEEEEINAVLRTKEALAREKLSLIDQFEEEETERLDTFTEGEKARSMPPGGAEVGSHDKAAAYVGELLKMQYQAVQQSEVSHSEEGAVVEDSEEYCPRGGSVVGTRTVSKSRRESTIDLVVESKHEQVKTR